MIHGRIISLSILPHLRPLTQNKLLSASDAAALVREYMQTGDYQSFLKAIDNVQANEDYIPLKVFVLTNLRKEGEKYGL